MPLQTRRPAHNRSASGGGKECSAQSDSYLCFHSSLLFSFWYSFSTRRAGPWAQTVPSGALYNWSSPLINTDFQFPNDGYEMPYNVAQFVFIYNNARIPDSSRPRNIQELIVWIKANPGRFAYPALSDGNFEANAFVRHIFYEYVGYAEFRGPFNRVMYNQRVAQLWTVRHTWPAEACTSNHRAIVAESSSNHAGAERHPAVPVRRVRSCEQHHAPAHEHGADDRALRGRDHLARP